jgi:hypothetical protein
MYRPDLGTGSRGPLAGACADACAGSNSSKGKWMRRPAPAERQSAGIKIVIEPRVIGPPTIDVTPEPALDV